MRTRPEDARQPDQPEQPDDRHQNDSHATAGSTLREPARCFRPMLGEDGGRNEPNRQREPERNENEIVEMADHGDEVRDEIDRAQRIGDRDRGDRLRRPRNAGVASREVEGVRVRLEGADARAQPGQCVGLAVWLRHRNRYPAAAPKRRPTPAVHAIATAPQNATRSAPRNVGAPPSRAAAPPRTSRSASVTATMLGPSAPAGSSAASIAGGAAPAA